MKVSSLTVGEVIDLALDNPFTEDALALRFSERHANDLRYVALKNQWFRWDGARWSPEPTLLAFDLARRSCREDAEAYANGKAPDRVFTAKTIAAVQTLARADRRQAATLDQFDNDPWLMTAGEATIDLRTGRARPPHPNDFITRKALYNAAPAGSPHPLWTAFLLRITAGDEELIGFLRRYLGYCLTGITSEHQFIFAYGTGANGKSTMVNTIGKILADYATTADVGTFLAHNHERHPTDIAKLHGARLVIAQETERGRRWDEVKIKSLTGGDRMTARFMRQDFFDFTPTFKLLVTGNNKPHLDNVDEAMRRRLLLVPFTVQIPPEERDPDLPAKLMTEAPAILRWCLEGCLEWQHTGLRPPAVVIDATAAYFEDQDVIAQWIEDCTEGGGPFAFTASGQLYASWRNWCDERGLAPGSAKSFTQALTDRGCQAKRIRTGARGFASIILRQQNAGPQGDDT
jgi:putative DNA primase/helicase